MIKRILKNKRLVLSIIMVISFLLSLFVVDWERGVFHTGGLSTLKQMFAGLINPDLSSRTLKIALIASWRTFYYALISISISIVMGLILGVLASGVLFGNKRIGVIFRGILGFLRAIHELVWAWLFVAAIGLSPIAAIFAIAIPYSGALGKVYADSINEVDDRKINSLKSTGAGKFQVLIYGYIPQAFKDMLSYTIYRLECAIRSSSVLSFIGLGGLGFEIQLALQDLSYSTIWVYIAFLVALVYLVDLWGSSVRSSISENNKRKAKISTAIMGVLMLAGWISVIIFDKGSLAEVFRKENIVYFSNFIDNLLGKSEALPAYKDIEMIKNTVSLSIDTMAMSLLAIGIASLSIVFTIPATRNVFTTRKSGKFFSNILYHIINAIFMVMRSVPELLWAMIFVFIFKPGIIPGALALGVHNFGVLGKLCTGVIEDMDKSGVTNLRTSGASRYEALMYGIVPQVMTKFINYILYRWEIVIRTTIVVGFVGAGGLGMAYKLAMSFFKYSEITLYLIAYLVMVYISEIITYVSKRYIRTL